MKPAILLTGGTGFLGKHFLEFLVRDGFQVVSVSRREQSASDSVIPVKWGADFPETIRKLVEERGLVGCIHLAGRINGTEADLREANEEFTRDLAESLRPFASRLRVVFLSSVSAIPPLPGYGESKRSAEKILQDCGFERCFVLRASLLYGKHDTKNIAWLANWIRRFPIVPVLGGRTITVQPLHVEDLYAVVKRCLQADAPQGGVFTVAGPRQERIWEIVDAIRRRLGRRVLRVPVPAGPVRAMARAVHWVFPRMNLPLQQLRSMSVHAPWDSSDATRELGFAPRPFSEGLREIL